MYKDIHCVDDAFKLKTDLNNIYKWCSENAMHLNLSKCSTITFSLKRIPIKFNYSLNNVNLSKITTMFDLEVKFDTKI